MGNETDPRFLRSREAIVAAARALLLEHGPSAVTHNRVSEHAGVGRATVYRHWPRTDQLLGEAMATTPMPFFREPGSPYRDWLIRELTAIADQLQQEDVLAVTTTLANAALWDPAMDARRAGFADLMASRLADALDQARRHGELEMTSDPATSAALVIGPIVYRATIEHLPADDALVRQCVDAIGTWTDVAAGP